jgi:hypothetical protein
VPAVADEELGPQFAFEIADLLRKRRPSGVTAFRGSTEMQFLGHRDEVVQLPEFHAIDRTTGVLGGDYQSVVIRRGPGTTCAVPICCPS